MEGVWPHDLRSKRKRLSLSLVLSHAAMGAGRGKALGVFSLIFFDPEAGRSELRSARGG